MILKLENPSYSYVGNGIISVSMDVVIYTDDGSTILYKKSISSRINAMSKDIDDNGKLIWQKTLIEDLRKQKDEIAITYAATMQLIQQAWPEASTPQEALASLLADVQGGING